ncbi:unnamed protein product [Periconia digitata]|uniref:laccase n=1 Tax=Periconia digitata TaxID=1303443 RepID=A0A9W4U6P9_9PLEO|nr:unnamed protein product [Periconia digitata]
MLFSSITGSCLMALASVSVAEKIPDNHILWGAKGRPTTLQARQAATSTNAAASTTSKVADAACTNGPFTRTCWSNGFSAATDFDAKWPTTGKTVSYNFELTNGTCNPDGSAGGGRPCQMFNNQFPGPTITANWGDTISVTLTNKLETNGTGIHWHGIRQLKTVSQDGVPGITECPLAPGKSKTYTFLATQFGTTWYHSHFSAQYGDGATGSIVINGPASSNYDIDLGAFPLTDWYYGTSWAVGVQSHNNLQRGAAPPPADTILINGTNVSGGGGKYSKTSNLIPGKKYRLRLINTSVDNTLRVSLDGHPLTVITSDLVPIKPWTTNWILIAIGQRYDVVFTATKENAGKNFWLRVNYASQCPSSGNVSPKAQGIFSYQNAADANPDSTQYVEPTDCVEPIANLVPWVKNTVDSTAFVNQVGSLDVDISSPGVNTNGQNIVVWGVNLSAINVEWEKPTLQYVKDKNTNYPSTFNLIEIPKENTWSYWIVQEPLNTRVPIPHPIHLHGHDFYVLGNGAGVFNKSTSPSTLKYDNPARRDTAFLPGGGWLAIAFPADNPGAWLMHCHIAWHVADGLAVQFLEAKDQIPLGDAAWDQTCSEWNTFQATMPFPKSDSGLKLLKGRAEWA